jgi:hypothetical protein
MEIRDGTFAGTFQASKYAKMSMGAAWRGIAIPVEGTTPPLALFSSLATK